MRHTKRHCSPCSHFGSSHFGSRQSLVVACYGLVVAMVSAGADDDGAVWLVPALCAVKASGLTGKMMRVAIFEAMVVDKMQESKAAGLELCTELQATLVLVRKLSGQPVEHVGDAIRVLKDRGCDELARRVRRLSRVITVMWWRIRMLAWSRTSRWPCTTWKLRS